jgi:PIN domain nuclease of toxin-antitoxin system
MSAAIARPDDPQLSARAKSALVDPANERWLSPISLLEIALKVRLGNQIA